MEGRGRFVRLTHCCALALLGLLAAPPVLRAQPGHTGSVKGSVTITKPPGPSNEERRRSLTGRYAPDAAESGILVDPRSARPYKLSETAVIYLEGDPPGKGDLPSPPAKHPVMDQVGMRFHPQVLPIVVGTTVDFPNGDPIFHNVFSYSQTREFDLGRYPMGDSRSVTFDQSGIVRVYCDIHSEMNATILVLASPYFTSLADDGSFQIDEVPEGRYHLNLWYGRDVVLRRTVTIRDGETTSVNLTY
ncbi:MAG TPA: hypothetical protein VEO56_11400 [Bacteroidota bacterium]|nr:hypothetical protein [Bacteroidota bacterium]